MHKPFLCFYPVVSSQGGHPVPFSGWPLELPRDVPSSDGYRRNWNDCPVLNTAKRRGEFWLDYKEQMKLPRTDTDVKKTCSRSFKLLGFQCWNNQAITDITGTTDHEHLWATVKKEKLWVEIRNVHGDPHCGRQVLNVCICRHSGIYFKHCLS